jgi:hypothetical protein
LAALALLAGASHSVAASPPCDDDHAIWAYEDQERRVILYFGDPPPNVPGSFESVHIEEWQGGKLIWRQNGLLTCSNGASTCYVVMEVVGDPDAPPDDNNLNAAGAPEVSAVIEIIDADEDGLSDWVVLAGLEQMTYYARGAKVEWFDSEQRQEREAAYITPENIYKFYSCKKQ